MRIEPRALAQAIVINIVAAVIVALIVRSVPALRQLTDPDA